MERLSDKARMHARLYSQPPYGREIEGTAELLLQMADKLEEYEGLGEQGKLPKLPCEIGHKVYIIYQFCGEGAWEIEEHKIRLEDLDKIGKTVFLSREEAEAALKEL